MKQTNLPTVLGSPMESDSYPDEEQLAILRWKVSRADGLIDAWIEGYKEGQVPFESCCKGIVLVAETLPDITFLLIGGKNRIVGDAVRRLTTVSIKREGRKNGFPEVLKRTAAQLVRAVREQEKLPINRANPAAKRAETAFTKVATIFKEAGVKNVTSGKVQKWYEDYAKDADIAES